MLSFAKVLGAVNCELRSSPKICAKRNGYQCANHPQPRAVTGFIDLKLQKWCAIYSKIRILFRIHFAQCAAQILTFPNVAQRRDRKVRDRTRSYTTDLPRIGLPFLTNMRSRLADAEQGTQLYTQTESGTSYTFRQADSYAIAVQAALSGRE